MPLSLQILSIHVEILLYILSLILIFDSVVYFRILIIKRFQWYQFIVSHYTPNWPFGKSKFFLILELTLLFILTFISFLAFVWGFYTTGYGTLMFGSLKTLSLVFMIGLAGISTTIACLASIQEVTGITYPTIKNIGVGQVGVKLVNGLIFLWIKDSETGKWYSMLLNAFKYTLWSLPISIIIAVCY